MLNTLDAVRDVLARAERWENAAVEDEEKARKLRDQQYSDVADEFEQSAKTHRRIAMRERELARRIAITPLGN